MGGLHKRSDTESQSEALFVRVDCAASRPTSLCAKQPELHDVALVKHSCLTQTAPLTQDTRTAPHTALFENTDMYPGRNDWNVHRGKMSVVVSAVTLFRSKLAHMRMLILEVLRRL